MLVSAKRNQFDNHKYLLNVSNGTIDLKTGKITPHNRENYISQITNVEYVEGAECPVWLSF